jgi:hypothetical protein
VERETEAAEGFEQEGLEYPEKPLADAKMSLNTFIYQSNCLLILVLILR